MRFRVKENVLVREAGVRTSSAFIDYLELTKPRITTLVVLTAVVGFFMGSGATFPAAALLQTILGTALVAAGAGVLNQVAERDQDARMVRTAAGQSRPAA